MSILTNISETGDLTNTVTTAYDLVANFALRPELKYAMVSTVRPTQQSHRGDVVSFPFATELVANTTALNESSNPAGKTMGDSLVSVTLVEYGDAVQTSAKLRGLDFLEVDAVAANLVGWQAGLSFDTLAREVLEDDSTITSADRKQFIGQTAESAITATDTVTATSFRKGTAQLRGDNSRPFGTNYMTFIHPDVSFDLREEGGTFSEGTTRTPYAGFGLFPYVAANDPQSADRVWDGFIGNFAGQTFIELSTPDINLTGGAGGTVDTYTTTTIGQEALAMAFSTKVSAATPQIVLGPVTDTLRRHATVGWYWLGGFAEFREESRHLIISASSLGGS